MRAWVTSVPVLGRRAPGVDRRCCEWVRPVCRNLWSSYASRRPAVPAGPGCCAPTAVLAVQGDSGHADQQVLHEVDHAVVLFRVGDLRVVDHPGLLAAKLNTRLSLANLFVFTPDTPRSAYAAVRRLRADLRARGSELYIRSAESECEGLVSFVLNERHCGRVHLRRDVDSRAMESARIMQERLGEGNVEFAFWREELRQLAGEHIRCMPDAYPEFLKWKPRTEARFSEPEVEFEPAVIVPGPPGLSSADTEGPQESKLEPGSVLDMERFFDSIRQTSELDLVEQRFDDDCARLGVTRPSPDAVPDGSDYGVFLVMDALSRLERYEDLDVGRALQDVFWLGLVSTRRLRTLVIEFERLQGRLFSPLFRSGASTILKYLDAREFANCLAERDLAAGDILVDGVHRPKFFRWRGFLSRYVEAGSPSLNAAGRPALLFIHGFGASAQHWGRNIEELSSDFHCFAFCNIGFGRAEKPPFQYTQLLWEVFQAEFVKEVVKSKCIVIGNSIGGYLSAAFAADAPGLCDGLVLVNSAGPILSREELRLRRQEHDSSEQTRISAPKERRSWLNTLLRESRVFRNLAGKLLLAYLQGNIEKTLARVYPTVDSAEWTEELAVEIRRNSLDFGAVDVIASGFILPPTRPLNDLLGSKVGPPILVFQGKLDPLGSESRVEKLKSITAPERVTFRVIEAGHCPHDEKPGVFCSTLREWTSEILDSQMARQPEPAVSTLGTSGDDRYKLRD